MRKKWLGVVCVGASLHALLRYFGCGRLQVNPDEKLLGS